MQTLHIFGKTVEQKMLSFLQQKLGTFVTKSVPGVGKRKPLGFSHQDRISSAPKVLALLLQFPFPSASAPFSALSGFSVDVGGPSPTRK